jgi:hypothetical protein
VWFVARRDHDDDTTTRIQLRLPDADNIPSDTIVDEVTMKQLSLTDSYEWVQKSFADAGGLSPNLGVCLTFITNDNNSAQLWVKDKDVVLANAGLSYGNPDWKPLETGRAVLFYAYGTVSTPGPPQTATRHYLTGVRVSLRAADDSAAQVETTAQTLNRPELLSGLWQAEFDTDPTLDHNGDGQSDWLIRSGAPFDTASLIDGVWYVDQPDLDTVPDNSFTTLTTIEVRFRSAGVGSYAVLSSNVDFSGGNFMPIIGAVTLDADGTQTLAVYAGWPLGVPLTWVPGLTRDFVTLRLLIDPDLDTVNVKLNGTDKGTFSYSPYPPTADPQSTTLTAWGGSAEFDYVSVRASE